MKYIVLIIFVFFASCALHAESGGTISGQIRDSSDGKPLAGVSVRLEGTSRGAFSNKDGTFQINNIKHKKYKIVFSLIGYRVKSIEIEPDADSIQVLLSVQPFQTGELVVSANKRVQSISELPVSVAVFDARAIIDKGITRLDRLLQYVPGVEVNKDNVIIRGSEGFAFGIGARSQLQLDGFPLIAGDNGDLKLDALPIFAVERVEVIKGTGSAFYGTGAMGGVISVITREPSLAPSYKARASLGLYTRPRYDGWVYDTKGYNLIRSLDAGYSNRLGNFGVTLMGSLSGDDGWRKFSQSYRNNAYAKVKYYASDKLEASMTTSYSTEKRDDWIYWGGLDSATFPPTNTDLSVKINTTRLALFGDIKYIFDDKRFALIKAGKFGTTFDDTRESSDPDKRQTIANSINAEALFVNRFTDKLIITSGANILNNNVSAKIYGERTQYVYSVYAQGEYKALTDLNLSVGARYDYEMLANIPKSEKVHLSKPQLSPKFGAIYTLSPELKVRASAGTGFRAPTVAERFVSTGFAGFKVKRNPLLKPERSKSYEAGCNWTGLLYLFPANIDFALFGYDMTDLIEPTFVQKPDGEISDSIQFKNLTRARILGGEVSVNLWLMEKLTMQIALTVLDPRDLSTNDILKYRSEILWYNTIGYQFAPFEAQIDYRYKSKVKLIDSYLSQVENFDARVAAHIVDARLIFHAKEYGYPFSVSINANNLFDYYYTEMVGNLAATRSIVLQLEWGM